MKKYLLMLILLILAALAAGGYGIHLLLGQQDAAGMKTVQGFTKFFRETEVRLRQHEDESAEEGADSGEGTSVQNPDEHNEESGGRDKIIFIGDSRTVGMYWALTGDQSLHEVHLEDENGDLWSAREGMGLAWMKSDGVPPVQDAVGEGTAVVILMGVNDIGTRVSAKDYLAYIETLSEDWTAKQAKVYYVSVNPVRSAISGGLSNETIDRWNDAMQEGLPESVQYIDTNAVIRDHIDFKDVLHYKDATNLEIYEYIVGNISEGEN